MQNPSQEAPAYSKVSNQDLEEMEVLCTFKTKIEQQNFSKGVSESSDHIKLLNPGQEPSVSSKTPNQD